MSAELPRPIGFLSDFGYADEFVAVCHAVIRTVDHRIDVIDVTHGIEAGDLRRGAMALSAFAAYSPATVLLAVVDPGVGGDRRALALRAGDHNLVGPDNGLLMLAADRLGGVDEAVEISDSPVRLKPASNTFHGRDIFSPVAAHLAAGAAPSDVGEPLDASGLVRIDLPVAEISEEEIVCHVLISDHYGNLTLNLDGTVLEESFLGRVDGVRVRTAAGPARMRVCRTFAEAAEDEAVLYTDSSGSLAMAVNHGSAAERLGLVPDDEIKLAPMP